MRIILTLLTFMLMPFSGEARELAVDLSKSVVPITADFHGSDLLLFGAANEDADIVVVVRGPKRNEVVRRKQRVFGIWTNGPEVIFENAPAYYAIAASRPLVEFLPAALASQHQIGFDGLKLDIVAGQSDTSGEYRRALIRNKQRQNLYAGETGQISMVGGKLFKTQLRFPANIPVGDYAIDVYVVRDGRIADSQTTVLGVQKFGIEAGVYDFAQRHSLAYGVLAVLLATVAGWIASVAFRKG
ncbi:MAG: TIGR02186 family protein [Alphaproteobacteria bacterium]